MAQNDVDSGQKQAEGGATNPANSQGGGDSGVQFDAQKLQSAFDSLAKKVNEIDAAYRTFQEGKDRGANAAKRFSDEVEELRRKVAEIDRIKKLTGIDDDDIAYKELKFRDDMSVIKEQLAKLNPVSAGNGAVDVAKVVVEYGLSANDPEVIAEVTARKWDDPEKAELAVARLAKRKASKPTPSGADAPVTPAAPIAAKGVDALTQEYIQKQQAARGKPAEIRANKDAYKKQGVDVDNVIFH